MKPNDIVKFKEPMKPSEELARFVVIQLRGKNVLVGHVSNNKIQSQYRVADLMVVNNK
jgi:hypothetical protein